MRHLFGGPSDRDLQRFADGETSSETHDRGAEHLVRCPECRARVAFARKVRAEARRLPVPEPSADLLQRVRADRAAGTRVILPAGDAPRKLPAPYWVGAAVAALIVIVLLPFLTRPPTSVSFPTDHAGTDSSSALPELFTSVGFPSGIAAAQELPPSALERALASAHPVTGVDGTRLAPRRLVFESLRLDSAGRIVERGATVIAIDSAPWRGQPAWQVVQTSRRGDFAKPEALTQQVETLFVGRDDLRPLARAVHVTPYASYDRINIEQEFSGDSVTGRMTAERRVGSNAMRPIARELPRRLRPFVTDPIGPLFLGAVSLSPTWSGVLGFVGWAVRPEDVIYPLVIRVTGEERITVPGGTFDCWTMSFTMLGWDHEVTRWVRKSDGVAVRTLDRTSKGTREMVLAGLAEPSAQGAAASREFRIDAGHSLVEFSIGFMGGRVKGRFSDVAGTLVHDRADPTRSSISVVIDVASLNTGSTHRDEHLRSEDFFDVAGHPKIVFRSERVTRASGGMTLTGPLTMHGTTRPVSIRFREAQPLIEDPHGSTLVAYEGSLRLARRDFGIAGGAKHNDWFDALRSATMADSVDVTLELAAWDTDFSRSHTYDGSVDRLISAGVAPLAARLRARKAQHPDSISGAAWDLEQIARAMFARSRTREPVELLELGTELFPTAAVSHAALARGFEILGDRQRARAATREALRLDPFNTRAMELERRLDARGSAPPKR